MRTRQHRDVGRWPGHGDIPFVHWHRYEEMKLGPYVERFGEPEGIAARVRSNLLDLLPVTGKAIVLPLPSYSLRAIEEYVGFRRSMEEYGGDWSVAKYVDATETGDEGQRTALMDEIRRYNREDVAATWAVLKWLKSTATSRGRSRPGDQPARQGIRRRGRVRLGSDVWVLRGRLGLYCHL